MLFNLDSPDGSGRSWVDWWLDWVPGRDRWASGHWDPVKMINIFKHVFFLKFSKIDDSPLWETDGPGSSMRRFHGRSCHGLNGGLLKFLNGF